MGKGSGVRSEAQLLRPQEVKLPVPPAALAARVGMVHYISTLLTVIQYEHILLLAALIERYLGRQ
jgi:hypothetical protein